MEKIKNDINWVFYISMFIACLTLIPIGAYLLSKEEYIVGIFGIIGGISLLTAFFNLFITDYFKR